MLLPNISPYDLLSRCFYRRRGGVDGYWETDFCWKIPYHIQKLYPHRQGEGASLMWKDVNRGERGQNHWKCTAIRYAWPHILNKVDPSEHAARTNKQKSPIYFCSFYYTVLCLLFVYMSISVVLFLSNSIAIPGSYKYV